MSGAARQFTYKSSDAWVLLAIVYAGRDGGASLAGIVGVADFIDHAILTYAELQNALFKLTSDGFIRDEGGRFFPSAATLDFYDRAPRKRRAILVELDGLARFLDAEPWTPGPDQFRQEFTYPGVTREAFESAVQEYLKPARRASARARPKKKAPRRRA